MYNIYIKTPLYKNSNYISHLIEHLILSNTKDSDTYFQNKKFSGNSYTYYIQFKLDTTDIDTVKNFIKYNILNPDFDNLKYEQQVLKDELSNKKHFNELIHKIWKKLYSPNFKYSKVQQLSKKEIMEYHKNNFVEKNMVILPDDYTTKQIKLWSFQVKNTFQINNLWNKEKVFVFDYTAENVFVVDILSSLFDDYIFFKERYINWKYYFNDTISWEFDDFCFLSIDNSYINKIKNISYEFIKSFVQYKLEKFDKDDFCDIHWPLQLQYGYTLSEKSQQAIIKNIEKYVKIINRW